jgi:hypothetical protein
MLMHGRDRRCLRGVLLTGVALAAFNGCSHSIDSIPAEMIPVEGMLTYHGQPVPEAQLIFRGDEPSEPAFAVTDFNGKFQCMTNDSSAGMPPGEYVVTISSTRVGIPGKYAAEESTPLRVTVEETGANQLRLELED